VAGGPPTQDEITQVLLGALPLVARADARRAAVIGFGTGVSTHVLLASPALEAVDTIEIEPAVVAAARRFAPLNARAYDDPRSRIHYEDAKTYFSSHPGLYDVIVSEPSNPWVSGVASLFSAEFYREARRRLARDGLLVQWLQIYDMTPQLVASVLGALGSEFPDYVVWAANPGDLIVVAARDARVLQVDARAFANPALAAALQRLSIRTLDDLLLHRIATRRTVGPYYASWGAPSNSDFFPFVDIGAAKARFMHNADEDLEVLRRSPIPLLALFEGDGAYRPDAARLSRADGPALDRGVAAWQSAAVLEYLRSGDALALEHSASLAADALIVRAAFVTCAARAPEPLLRDALLRVAGAVNASSPRRATGPMWAMLAESKCPAAPGALHAWVRLHQAIDAGAGEGMAEAAQEVLAREHALSDQDLCYVGAALMAGRILSGDRLGALRALSDHRAAFKDLAGWQTVFRFLLAQVNGRLAP
jgi:hypothetical protein